MRRATLPTFAAVARSCRELGLLANVEIKPAAATFEVQTGEVVARAIVELWRGAALPFVSSFSEAALAAAATASHSCRSVCSADVRPSTVCSAWQRSMVTACTATPREIDDETLAEAAREACRCCAGRSTPRRRRAP